MRKIDARYSLDGVHEFLTQRKEAARDLAATVAEVGLKVRQAGWAGIAELTTRFDRIPKEPRMESFRVSAEEFDAAKDALPPELKDAIEVSITRVRTFHQKQKRHDWYHEEPGIRTGQRFLPLERVGVYAPGGEAVLFSTLVMNIVPAQVAGCPSVTVCSPPQKSTGNVDRLILATCHLLGLDHTQILGIGGAQAIFAMAMDLPGFPRVDGVFGPGNAYVMEAKRQIQGEARIESLPGNSEILIIADEAAEPRYVAADLLSQSEHAGGEMSILVTPSEALIGKVELEVQRQLAVLDRREIATRSLSAGGALVLTQDIQQACMIANLVAPEHLEIQTQDPNHLLDNIQNAGAVFLGPWSTEPIGDYTAGTNHVLPTGGTARFSSALSVDDFMKKISIVHVEAVGLQQIGPPAMSIARAEGLTGHERAIDIRLKDLGKA